MDTDRNRWQDWLMLVLGAWLFFSPFFMAYGSIGDPAALNAFIVGAAVGLFAIWSIYAPGRTWEGWISLLLGGWLVFAPFLFGFYGTAQVAAWNSIAIGALIVADAIWTIAGRHPPATLVHHP